MSKVSKATGTEARIEYWRARIAEQEHSGLSVVRFCQERQLSEQSFYMWRKRFRQPEPVRFALVERGTAPAETAWQPMLELVLRTGERLCIGRGIDEATLRTVLAVLRA